MNINLYCFINIFEETCIYVTLIYIIQMMHFLNILTAQDVKSWNGVTVN